MNTSIGSASTLKVSELVANAPVADSGEREISTLNEPMSDPAGVVIPTGHVMPKAPISAATSVVAPSRFDAL